MLKAKIICILLAIILILSSSIVSFAVENNENTENSENVENNVVINSEALEELTQQREELDGKLEEANSKLEYVQGEMSSSLLEIQQLSDKIIEYENENEDLKNKLSTLEASITETTQLLDEVTAEYTYRYELLKQRLVIIYEAGELTYLDLLLSSTTLSEFLSRYYAMREMAEYDNELIDQVEEQKEVIETSKAK